MPPPATIPALREIHRLRSHAQDLAQRIEQAPRQLKAQETALRKAEESLTAAKDRIKHLKVEIHDKETNIKAIVGVIKKHEKQLNEAGNKKEYDALQLEIKHEKESIQKIEDEVLETMGQVEELMAQIPEKEKQTAAARATFATYKSEQADRLARLQADRQKAIEELSQVETQLPDDILSHYKREVASKGADALSAVEGRICISCHTEITAQMLNDLTRSMWVLCKACGRILYMQG